MLKKPKLKDYNFMWLSGLKKKSEIEKSMFNTLSKIEHFLLKIPDYPVTRSLKNWSMFLLVLVGTGNYLQAQSSSDLFFKEDWKQNEAALPVTQEHVENPDLELSLHGPGKKEIKKSNHEHIPDDPYYVWSGECSGNWAVSLKHRTKIVDLTGSAEIKWRAKQSGFRQLRVILKLSDGSWLISDQYDGDSNYWREKNFKMSDLRWRELNIERVVEGNWVDDPDLSRVEEIGFSDLMVGGKSKASSRLDWIEVYGKVIEI